METTLKTDGNAIATQIPTSAYLHIPFCRRRCFYCDFPIAVMGDRATGETSGTMMQYLDLLCQEIAIAPVFAQPLQTIFFGGGTPSLLSVAQVERILHSLDRQFGIAPNAEISMEMDPGTFDHQQLQGYINVGINRVSLGVQAFQDELLHLCGRSHTVAEIFAAVELLHQVGVKNFSLDLISGLPHQTLEMWQASLAEAIAIAPPHISSYDLIVEPGTPFARYYQPGNHPLPTDEMSAAMYRQAQQFLTAAGYEHYEISNYALAGYQCLHNRVYWENRPYYGFGMGAASYLAGYRFTRPRKTREYRQWVHDLVGTVSAHNPLLNFLETHAESVKSDYLLETLMLGLRLAQGLSIDTLLAKFGEPTLQKIWDCLQPYSQQGFVQIIAQTGEILSLSPEETLPKNARIHFSDPEGFLLSNTILSALFSAVS